MTLTLPRDLDLNSICHLHKWHQRIDLAETMCLGQRTPKKRLHTCFCVLWYKSYVFYLTDGGHLGSMGHNDVITWKWCQNRNSRGRLTGENVFIRDIFGALVQTLIFRDGASGHFGFGPLAEHASISQRDFYFKMVHRSEIKCRNCPPTFQFRKCAGHIVWLTTTLF